MNGLETKACSKCGQRKPVSEFYALPKTNKCKVCYRADVMRNRTEKREKYIDFDRRRAALPHRREQRKRYSQTPAGIEATRKARANYSERYPEKKQAHTTFCNAVRDGRIEPKPCEACGATEAEGHHFDYSRPLDVVWLCKAHHAAYHKIERRVKELQEAVAT